jgi:hypothetical protein
MSFEQAPPDSGQAALPSAPAAVAPIYRQDEFVRSPTSWTRPMQLAVAAYLVISTLISLASQLVFANEVKAIAAAQMAKSFKASGRAFTDADVKSAVDLGLALALVFGLIFAIIFVVLAILSVTGTRTWVFWVDLVLLALGIFGLLSAVTSFSDPASAQIPAGARPFSLLSGLADLGLVVWMIVALVKYGPWAQEKVPAAL